MITSNGLRTDAPHGPARSLSGLPMKGNDLLLVSGGTERTFRKGETIYRVDELPHGMYYIAKGKVKVYKLGILGKEQIVRLAKDGELLGYRSLISDDKHSTTAVALEESTLYFIQQEVFFRLCTVNNGLLQKVLMVLADELKSAQSKVVTMAQKTTRSRLAEALLLLSEKYGLEADNATLRVMVTRQELADYIGTATESVIRLLSEFRQERMIDIAGRRIKILNHRALQSMSDARI